MMDLLVEIPIQYMGRLTSAVEEEWLEYRPGGKKFGLAFAHARQKQKVRMRVDVQ